MSFELKLSGEASACIVEQMKWFEADESHGGPVLADRWLDRLEASMHKLADNPTRHGFAPENGRWMPHLKLRQMRFRPWKSKSAWRILYVIDETSSIVTVIQIRHSRRPFLFEQE